MIEKTPKTLVMIASMHGATIMRLAANLKFGGSLTTEAIPGMIILPPSEYFVTLPGFKEPPYDAAGPIPASVSSLLESWNVDTSTNHPQYLSNSNYLLQQADGQAMNGLTVVLTKNFQQNNLRILLHGGESPNSPDDQLFFIDIDEENM